MEPPPEPAHRSFSINQGGPFAGLIARLHLVQPSGLVRIWWIVGVSWVPMMLGTIVRLLVGAQPDPLILDISVHARLLAGLPLLLVASHLLEPQCRGAVHQLYVAKIAGPAEADAIIDRAEQLRDAVWVEVVVAAVALTLGQLALWGVTGPTGLVPGHPHAIWSFSRVWYTTLALPLVQFLALRWLWRWVVWNYIVARLSRLPLATTATHPDYAAGLSFLSWPLGGFTWFVAADASVFAGAWGTQLLNHRATVPSLLPTMILLLVGAAIVGCGPLLLLSGHVYRARRRDLAAYGLFTLEYVRQFRAKWIEGHPSELLLGTPDIQSLNDLGSAFQVIVSTKVYVFSMARLKNIFLAVLIPMLPLTATLMPLESMIQRLTSAALGGLPL